MKKLVYIEITNTIASKSVSGIQRVTRELIINLTRLSYNIQMLVYCTSCKSYRKATLDEVNNILLYETKRITLIGMAKNFLAKKSGFHRCANRIEVADLEPNSVFLEVEAAWHNPYSRNQLLPILLSQFITPINLHYDLIPILFPEFTPDHTKVLFEDYMNAHFKYTRHFICISDSCKQALKTYLMDKSLFKNQHITSFQLGSNFNEIRKLAEENLKHKFFILAVGTIEVRKNRITLLNCFDKLRAEFPQLELVLVGKQGWKVDTTIDEIRKHQDYNKRLFWYDSMEDKKLTALYKNAYLLVEPSFYEGYGLPIVEALRNECVVLSSDRGALPEAGGGYAVYFDPNDEDALSALIRKCILDKGYYRSIKDNLKNYQEITWEVSISQFSERLINSTEN